LIQKIWAGATFSARFAVQKPVGNWLSSIDGLKQGAALRIVRAGALFPTRGRIVTWQARTLKHGSGRAL
jgi:hypothetical protein